MNREVVSIIMPCYNAAAYIADAISSVLTQSHKDLELIIINDGSTDASLDVINTFADERIRIFNQPNKGQCAASNFGLSVATGDYIKFFDADDVMNDVHIEEQLKAIEGNQDVIASCAWGRFYDNDYQSAKFIAEDVWKNMLVLDWIKTAMGQPADMMAAWVWLIPRTVINRAGGWDERLSLNNDFEFSVRLLLHAKEVRFCKKAKMYYRSGISSLSRKSTHQSYSKAILSNQLGCSYLLQRDNSEEMRLLCANRYQQWIYRIYPQYPDLVKQLREEVERLGGSSIVIEGGRMFQLMRTIFGWKMAKKLQQLSYSLGYQPS